MCRAVKVRRSYKSDTWDYMTDATITQIPQKNEEALRQGYLAGRRGLPASANPFRAGTKKAEAWLQGRRQGQNWPIRVVEGEPVS